MEYDFHPFHRPAYRLEAPEVSLQQIHIPCDIIKVRPAAGGEIIENADIVTAAESFPCYVAAYESGTAGYQTFHRSSPFSAAIRWWSLPPASILSAAAAVPGPLSMFTAQIPVSSSSIEHRGVTPWKTVPYRYSTTIAMTDPMPQDHHQSPDPVRRE